jgi:hypothetical protein
MQNWNTITFVITTAIFLYLILKNWGSRPWGVPSMSMYINAFFIMLYLFFFALWGGIFWW